MRQASTRFVDINHCRSLQKRVITKTLRGEEGEERGRTAGGWGGYLHHLGRVCCKIDLFQGEAFFETWGWNRFCPQIQVKKLCVSKPRFHSGSQRVKN